eukprot:4076585-Amphidinium_carterae.1
MLRCGMLVRTDLQDLINWTQLKQKHQEQATPPSAAPRSDEPLRRQSLGQRPLKFSVCATAVFVKEPAVRQEEFSKRPSFAVDLAALEEDEEIDLLAMDEEARREQIDRSQELLLIVASMTIAQSSCAAVIIRYRQTVPLNCKPPGNYPSFIAGSYQISCGIYSGSL